MTRNKLNEKTTLTPALRADYTWLKSQSYNESGADAYLQHRFSNVSRLDARFGIGYDAVNERGIACWTLRSYAL